MEHWQLQCNAIGADAVDITPESREFGRFGATWHQASKGPNVRRSDSSSAAAVPHLPHGAFEVGPRHLQRQELDFDYLGIVEAAMG